MISATRQQRHVPDVPSTLEGIANALAQLQLAGAPPDAAISVTSYGFSPRVLVAADWAVSE